MELLTPLETNAYKLPNGMALHIKHEGELEAGSFKQCGMTRVVGAHPDEDVFCLASAVERLRRSLATQRAGKRAEIFIPKSTPTVKKNTPPSVSAGKR